MTLDSCAGLFDDDPDAVAECLDVAGVNPAGKLRTSCGLR